MLSDRDITAARYVEEIIIDPYQPERLQPNSYDVTLSSSFSFFEPIRTFLVTNDQSRYFRKVVMKELTIEPGQFVLASTIEWIKLAPWIAAKVEGKSSLARLGLTIHTTAGFIDAGFEGQVTLELLNNASKPMVIPVGAPVAQLSFHRLDTSARNPYKGKYQGQLGATPSAYHKNFEATR